MTLGFPLFVVVVGGFVFGGVFGVVVGVLAFRFGLSSGRRDLFGRLIVPFVGFGIAALLIGVNPIDGEYKASLLYVVIGPVLPFATAYDLYRLFQDRNLAQERIEREAEQPAWDLSKLKPLRRLDD